MPAWLIGLLINIALKMGWAWLTRHFPWLPQEVKDEIQNAVDNIKKVKKLPSMTPNKLKQYKAQTLESVKFVASQKTGKEIK